MDFLRRGDVTGWGLRIVDALTSPAGAFLADVRGRRRGAERSGAERTARLSEALPPVLDQQRPQTEAGGPADQEGRPRRSRGAQSLSC